MRQVWLQGRSTSAWHCCWTTLTASGPPQADGGLADIAAVMRVVSPLPDVQTQMALCYGPITLPDEK